MINVKINIKGRVQGVGFRFNTRKIAKTLNINGFVKNIEDESVYIEAEGIENNIAKFIKWCNIRPIRAQVNKVDYKISQIKNYKKFIIKY